MTPFRHLVLSIAAAALVCQSSVVAAQTSAYATRDVNRRAALLVDAVLRHDSASWFSRYDAGSVSQVSTFRSQDGSWSIMAGYSYGGGTRDQVSLFVWPNGRLDCVKYRSQGSTCRPVGKGGSGMAARLAIGAVAAIGAMYVLASARRSPNGAAGQSGSGGYSGQSIDGSEDAARYERERQRQEQQLQRNEVPRIGGEGGLYGCASPPCWDRP